MLVSTVVADGLAEQAATHADGDALGHCNGSSRRFVAFDNTSHFPFPQESIGLNSSGEGLMVSRLARLPCIPEWVADSAGQVTAASDAGRARAVAEIQSGRRAMKSISTRALRASAVTPMQVLAGRRSREKYDRYTSFIRS